MSLTGQFYRHPVFNAEKSKEAGRKIFEDKIYIEIRAKGDKNTSFGRVMCEKDKTDFARAWQQFTAENGGDEDSVSGTPLRYLPAVGPSLVLELRAVGINTVEDILDLDDAALMRIRGGRLLQRQAQAYLAAAAASEGETIDNGPIETGDEEATAGSVGDEDFISDLNGSAATKEDAGETAEPARGRGRPRKVEGA